jgi:hypothetical protein
VLLTVAHAAHDALQVEAMAVWRVAVRVARRR